MSTPEQEAWSRQTLSLAGRPPMQPAEAHPVIGLRELSTGQSYLLDDFRLKGQPKRILLIGAAAQCDIRLHDPAVSAHHCLILRARHDARVYLHDAGSRNGTLLGGAAIRTAELREGFVLTLGSTHLCAISAHLAQAGLVITAATVAEFLSKAKRIYGSVRAAALGIGISPSTLHHWFQDNRYGLGQEPASAPAAVPAHAPQPATSLGSKTASAGGRSLRRAQQTPEHPVIGLRDLNTGELYRFDAFHVKGKPKQLISIGTDAACDVRPDDLTASSVHCYLRRHASAQVSVHDCGSRNGTLLNGIETQSAELTEGSVLTVGNTRLCAVSARSAAQGIILAASTFYDFIRQAKASYGGIRPAAHGIGVSPSTLAGWFHDNRFGLRDDKDI